MTLFYSYFGKNYVEKFSWIVADGSPFYPNGIIGMHAFGDFVVPYIDAQSSDMWGSKNLYPPFAMLFFKTFTLLPTIQANLVFYMFVLVFSSICFMLHALLQADVKNDKRIFIFFIVLTSAPFITLIDRGNNYFLIPILFYLTIKNLDAKRIYKAAFFFGVAIALKTYPVFMLVFFLTLPRFILGSLATSIFLTLISLISMKQSPQDFFFTYFENLITGPAKTFNVFQSSSFVNAVNQLLDLFSINFSSSIVYSSILTLLVMVILIVLFALLPVDFRFIVFLFASQVFLPNSFYYNKLWVIPFIAIFFSRQSQANLRKLRNSDSILKLSYAFIAVSLSHFSFPGSSFNIVTFVQFALFIFGCRALIISKPLT